MILKICKTCREKFEGHNSSKYCSDKCKPPRYKLLIPITEVCLECGKELTKKENRGRKQLYCSTKCRGITDNRRRRELKCIRKKSYIKTCIQCEIEFKTYRKDQRFCSPTCDKISRRTLIGVFYNCVICGQEYEKTSKNQECCSTKCGRIKAGNVLRIYPDKPDKLERRRAKEAIRRRTDLMFVLSNRMRCLMYQALHGTKNNRKWEDLSGYSVDALHRYLEKNMPAGYTWQDVMDRKLEMDHIIPISAFNFTKPEHIDFKKCWALSNLQLLTGRENRRKYNKLDKPFQPSLLIE